MNKILTLIKRDLTDYRGALIITPLAIAAFVIVITLLGATFGQSNLNSPTDFSFHMNQGTGAHFDIDTNSGNHLSISKAPDGTLMSDDGSGPKPLKVDKPDISNLGRIFALSSGIAGFLPLLVALIVVLFVLSSSLTNEKTDRSIMFWKSLPIGDFQTIGGKYISIIGWGLGFAFVVSCATQVIIMAILLAKVGLTGFGAFISPEILPQTIGLWGLVLMFTLTYILWAAPIYSWFLAVSAYVSRASFIAAILPILLLPVVARIFLGHEGWDFFVEPLYHLSGGELWKNLEYAGQSMPQGQVPATGEIIARILPQIFSSMASPSFLIGLIIAAGLFYAAGEIRRRHAI